HLREFYHLFISVTLDPHCFHDFPSCSSLNLVFSNTIPVSPMVKRQLTTSRSAKGMKAERGRSATASASLPESAQYENNYAQQRERPKQKRHKVVHGMSD